MKAKVLIGIRVKNPNKKGNRKIVSIYQLETLKCFY